MPAVKGDTLKRPDNFIGFMVSNVCPDCGQFLMKNSEGNMWCSNLECDYHVRGNKRVHPVKYERKIQNTPKPNFVPKEKISDIIKKFTEKSEK